MARCAPWSVLAYSPFPEAAADCRGCRPAQAWASVRSPAHNRDRTWTHGRHQCRRHPGCALPAASADGLSQLCGGRAPAGSARLPATLPYGRRVALRRSAAAKWGRQWRRGFFPFRSLAQLRPGLPAAKAGLALRSARSCRPEGSKESLRTASVRLIVAGAGGKSQSRPVRRHSGLCMPQRPRRCR